jgi:3-deoxy-D-manno-octulosonic-acid transferase
VIEALAGRLYRGAMTATAGLAGAVARLPGAPVRWRAVGDRLGRLTPDERATAVGGTVLWLHAASVGELVAARPLLVRLRETYPGRLYVVSTLTRTGLALARDLPEAHLALLFPIDAPATVRRLIARFRLEAFLFTETEIWPTFLAALAAAEIPTFMVSGRVSARTAAHARWLRPLYRPALAAVTCCMQTEDDARRILALGADARRVVVAGNLKFDGAAAPPPPELERVAAALQGRRVIVAGSTHEGEDEAVLAAYARLLPRHPDVVVLLAPRHPERFAAAAAAVTAAGFPLVRFGALADGPGGARVEPPAVVLLDRVGPLAHCYGLGVVAFVGGSLVPAGGHNVLEPARAGRAVLVGPHTEHAAEVVDRLVAGGGAVRARSADALAAALGGLLDEPARAANMGRRARALVESGRGAVERHVKVIAARLSGARFARAAAGEASGG